MHSMNSLQRPEGISLQSFPLQHAKPANCANKSPRALRARVKAGEERDSKSTIESLDSLLGTLDADLAEDQFTGEGLQQQCLVKILGVTSTLRRVLLQKMLAPTAQPLARRVRCQQNRRQRQRAPQASKPQTRLKVLCLSGSNSSNSSS